MAIWDEGPETSRREESEGDWAGGSTITLDFSISGIVTVLSSERSGITTTAAFLVELSCRMPGAERLHSCSHSRVDLHCLMFGGCLGGETTLTTNGFTLTLGLALPLFSKVCAAHLTFSNVFPVPQVSTSAFWNGFVGSHFARCCVRPGTGVSTGFSVV